MSEFNYHNPVMLKEVLSFVKPSMKSYVDLTLGRAGHASEILKKFKKGSSFYGVDRDQDALDFSKKKLEPFEDKIDLHFIHSRYSKAISLLRESGVQGCDFILMDIGVSSPQFDDPSRGFSYRFDSSLDMRMDKDQRITAKDIINTYSEKELCRVFSELGQCKIYYPVVKKIMQVREEKEINTTFELVDIIKSSLPKRELMKQGHPAKQFFLGLRYEVNQEIEELKNGLLDAIKFLNPKGRLVIISFNSEEDKIVKNIMKSLVDVNHGDKYHPIIDQKESEYQLLTKKPLVPTEEEIAENNRSKPSILRAIERR